MPSTILGIVTLYLVCYLSVSSAQRPCGQGQFFNTNVNKCRLCPPGTYQNNNDATACKQCPPGSYYPFKGAQGFDACIECNEGTFNDKPGATAKSACKKCPANTFSRKGYPKCISCPAGQFIYGCVNTPLSPVKGAFILDTRGSCITCIPALGVAGGSCSLAGPIMPQCVDCFSEQVALKPNSPKCGFCPAGSVRTNASTCTPITPVICPAGTERTFAQTCDNCVGLEFNDGSFERCQQCPPGFVPNKMIAADKCVPCPLGTVKPGFDGQCNQCQPGENSSARGAQICIPDGFPCPSNYALNSNGGCIRCSTLERYSKRQKKCIRCPKKRLSKGGLATKCSACPRGAIVRISESGNSAECVCRPGFGFGNGEGPLGGKCRKCPPGTQGEPTSFCSKCREGSFAPKRGTKTCKSCPPGTLQPRRGQKRCVGFRRCKKKGLIRSSKTGFCVVPATNCPPKHRRIEFGEFFPVTCSALSCPKGQFLELRFPMVSGEQQCAVCNKQQRFVPNPISLFWLCRACKPNEVSDGGVSQTCRECPKGLEGKEGICRCSRGKKVNGECVQCPAGTFGYPSTPGCTSCPAGTFKSEQGGDGGIDDCLNCQPGTFSDAGATGCKPCPGGTTTYGVGDGVCVPVPSSN